MAAGRVAGEDGIGDAVLSSLAAAEDGESADAAMESLADSDGMSRQWRRCDCCPLALIVGDGVCEQLNFLCKFCSF